MKKITIIVLVLILGAVFYKNFSAKKTATSSSTPVDTLLNSEKTSDEQVVVSDLEIPWEMVFLPGGDMLVTERPGRLLRIGSDKKVIEVSGVRHVGEGGLLGMALDPQFGQNHFLYLYLTSDDGGNISNRVERYVFENDTLRERKVILNGLKGSSVHDGGRIAFGPDNLLYIATGDAGETSLAQNKNSLNGKILRVRSDGSVPQDNPFGNAVYSYGHRNVQGITWDDGGNMWATEHGRSGVRSGFDELNKIEMGKNYGWPTIQGDETREGMVSPIIHSGARETWAPSGMTFIDGTIYFAGLRGESLYSFGVESRQLSKLFEKKYGRLRAVVKGVDGALYILTNNTDGRGNPQNGDDKIIRL